MVFLNSGLYLPDLLRNGCCGQNPSSRLHGQFSLQLTAELIAATLKVLLAVLVVLKTAS